MALNKDHISNIDLFLNSKKVLGVEARDVNTGAVMKFDSRSRFLDYVSKSSSVRNSKASLSGILTYRILTNRDFFGYRIKLVDVPNSKKTRGNIGRAFQGCLLGSTNPACKSKVNRHRNKKVWLVDAKSKKVTEFESLKTYSEHARQNGLTIAVRRKEIDGIRSVGKDNYLVASRSYLKKNILKKYYWVKNSKGKFVKGFGNFDDLFNYIGEKNRQKVLGAVGNGTAIRGKRIVVRNDVNTEFFKQKGLVA